MAVAICGSTSSSGRDIAEMFIVRYRSYFTVARTLLSANDCELVDTLSLPKGRMRVPHRLPTVFSQMSSKGGERVELKWTTSNIDLLRQSCCWLHSLAATSNKARRN